MQESDIIIITGHYGAGKTNLAVNLARDMAQSGPVTLFDLDIVNPYFRSADFASELAGAGVTVEAPAAANTNLDLPAISGRLEAALRTGERRLILDVGGDDAGAVALGRFAPLLEARGYRMWYVVNRFRYLTHTPEEAAELLREIEAASRLRATDLVNNSNLGPATTAEDIAKGYRFAGRVSELTGLPLLFTAVRRDLAADVPGRRDVDLYVRLPF